MKTRLFVLVCVMMVMTAGVYAETARGVVFHDKNTNGILDAAEKGIAKVLVSNGRDIVATDKSGCYELDVNADDIVFVIKPSGWIPPITEEKIFRSWYAYKPSGSPENLKFKGFDPTGPLPDSIDFPLMKHKEPSRFEVLILGDTQVHDQYETDLLGRDVVAELVGSDALFGMVLGDVTFDNLNMFRPLNAAIAPIGIPFHYVIGNHDQDETTTNNNDADEAFESVYGPHNNAFEYGDVHFINLDNVYWNGEKYYGFFDEEQMTFVRNYLATVPKEHLVVLLMHIPLIGVDNKEVMMELLSEFPNTVSFAAHGHAHSHYFMGAESGWTREEPHHHIMTVTACGSWFCGNLDEVGIPHTVMFDGVPNGYLVASFDKNTYSFRFKGARMPESHQMNIFAPDEVKVSDTGQTDVIVNVFNGSPRSTVEMDVNGEWLPLTRALGTCPFFAQVKARETWVTETFLKPMHKGEGAFHYNRVPDIRMNLGYELPGVGGTEHIWSAKLPVDLAPGLHMIEVRTTDMFGQTYTDRRAIRVIE